MVEIEREKVIPEKGISQDGPDLLPRRRTILSLRGLVVLPLILAVTGERGSRSVFVPPPRQRNGSPGSATMLDRPLNICLSPTKVVPRLSSNDSHRVSSGRKIHGGTRREKEETDFSPPLPPSLPFLRRISPHARRTIGRSEINGSVYLAH